MKTWLTREACAAPRGACAQMQPAGTERQPRNGYFFVGGNYVEVKTGPLMQGQMYVEYLLPENRTQPYPIVMIHGAAQTGTLGAHSDHGSTQGGSSARSGI